MTVLDLVARWVQDLLVAVLPTSAAAVLWVPVFVLVVVTGSTLVVRKLLVPLARASTTVLGWTTVGVGAVALLPEAAIASGFRQASRRPPAAVYGLGDAVAAGVAALERAIGRITHPVSRLSRVNFVVVALVAAAWIWLWNAQHCPDAAVDGGTCIRPITAWWSVVAK